MKKSKTRIFVSKTISSNLIIYIKDKQHHLLKNVLRAVGKSGASGQLEEASSPWSVKTGIGGGETNHVLMDRLCSWIRWEICRKQNFLAMMSSLKIERTSLVSDQAGC